MSVGSPDDKTMLERIMALEMLVAGPEMARERMDRPFTSKHYNRYPSLHGIETYSDSHKSAHQIVQEMTIPIFEQLKKLDNKNNAEFTVWRKIQENMTGSTITNESSVFPLYALFSPPNLPPWPIFPPG